MKSCKDSIGKISKIAIYNVSDFKEDAYGNLKFKRKYGKQNRLPVTVIDDPQNIITNEARLNITI